MPSNAVTVTATYKDAPVTTYTLTVTSGTGGGSYAANAQVPITANTAPSGKVFDQWTSSNGGSFANVNSTSTTFTMPSNAVTVTATYKDDIPDANEAVEEEKINYYVEGSSLIVKSSAVAMTAVEIYSISGQLVARQMGLNAPEVRIENLPQGVLIVRIISGDETETIKIAVRR
jgi:hypothetical protein